MLFETYTDLTSDQKEPWNSFTFLFAISSFTKKVVGTHSIVTNSCQRVYNSCQHQNFSYFGLEVLIFKMLF